MGFHETRSDTPTNLESIPRRWSMRGNNATSSRCGPDSDHRLDFGCILRDGSGTGYGSADVDIKSHLPACTLYILSGYTENLLDPKDVVA